MNFPWCQALPTKLKDRQHLILDRPITHCRESNHPPTDSPDSPHPSFINMNGNYQSPDIKEVKNQNEKTEPTPEEKDGTGNKDFFNF